MTTPLNYSVDALAKAITALSSRCLEKDKPRSVWRDLKAELHKSDGAIIRQLFTFFGFMFWGLNEDAKVSPNDGANYSPPYNGDGG